MRPASAEPSASFSLKSESSIPSADALASATPSSTDSTAAVAREAGAVVAFPDAGYDGVSPGLDLDMRSSVLAATNREILERLTVAAAKVQR